MYISEIPNIDFRTNNEPFKLEMERFLRHIVSYTSDLFYENGGPVILLQIENEYGNVEKDYGHEGHKYIEWAADLTKR